MKPAPDSQQQPTKLTTTVAVWKVRVLFFVLGATLIFLGQLLGGIIHAGAQNPAADPVFGIAMAWVLRLAGGALIAIGIFRPPTEWHTDGD